MAEWLIDRDTMTQEQLRLLDNQRLDERLLITGPPGSGKTIMALHLARKINSTRGNNSVLFLVFTRILKSFLSAGMQELGISSSGVMLAYSWYNHNRINRKYVIVDEAQDFCLNEQQATNADFRSGSIKEINKHADSGLMLFADFSQRIYEGRDWEYKDLEETINSRPVPVAFRQNFRTPEKIGKVASQLLDADKGQELIRRCVNKDASAVAIALDFKNLEKKVKYITALIKTSGLTDVAIVVPTLKKGKLLFNELQKVGLICEAYINTPQNPIDTIDFNSSNPKLLTYHSVKGLQFHTVIIAFGELEPQKTAQLFVGITRAKQQLIILYQDILCSSLDGIPIEILPRDKWRG